MLQYPAQTDDFTGCTEFGGLAANRFYFYLVLKNIYILKRSARDGVGSCLDGICVCNVQSVSHDFADGNRSAHTHCEILDWIMRCNDCELMLTSFKYTETYPTHTHIHTFTCITSALRSRTQTHQTASQITNTHILHIRCMEHGYLFLLFDWDIYRGYFILDWLEFFSARIYVCFRIYHLRCIAYVVKP